MDKIIIEGGRALKGHVSISGAKNASLPLMASTLLNGGKNILRNIPDLVDIKTMGILLSHLGAEIERKGDILIINTMNIKNCEAPYELVRTMRASVLVLGPLVARYGRARVSLPGGCAIGARPVDLHLKGLHALGADIEIRHGYIEASCKRLRGNVINLDIPTVTGTENIMMAAVLAEGRTIINNAAKEPEVIELAKALQAMGARISGAGDETIIIDGVPELRPIDYAVMPDRIEAGTFMVAAAITGGDIRILNAPVQFMTAVVDKLRESGVEIIEEDHAVRVIGKDEIRSVDVKTAPYPGFPTDMQAQIMALMCISKGISVIRETIFENRFMHVSELRRMGADIKLEGNCAIVRGVRKLSGAPVMATDLRASASLILAGLVAEGRTEVLRVYHLDRGYERIEEKMASLGAKIWRVRER